MPQIHRQFVLKAQGLRKDVVLEANVLFHILRLEVTCKVQCYSVTPTDVACSEGSLGSATISPKVFTIKDRAEKVGLTSIGSKPREFARLMTDSMSTSRRVIFAIDMELVNL